VLHRRAYRARLTPKMTTNAFVKAQQALPHRRQQARVAEVRRVLFRVPRTVLIITHRASRKNLHYPGLSIIIN
jgi:hypothetical protein